MKSYESTAAHKPEPVPQALLAATSLAIALILASAIIFEDGLRPSLEFSGASFRETLETSLPVSAASAVGAGRGVVAALYEIKKRDSGVGFPMSNNNKQSPWNLEFEQHYEVPASLTSPQMVNITWGIIHQKPQGATME